MWIHIRSHTIWILDLKIKSEFIHPGGWGLETNRCLSKFWHIQLTLKEFKLNTLYSGFGADKTFTTRWSGRRVQVWVQFRGPASHLAITPEGYSKRQSKVMTAKSLAIAELFGPRSRLHSLGGLDGQAAFPSQWQSARGTGPGIVTPLPFTITKLGSWKRLSNSIQVIRTISQKSVLSEKRMAPN